MKKIALLFVCINERYWPFLKDINDDVDKFFLPGHQVDKFIWSDMPGEKLYGGTVISTESVSWPYPTLMRYHLFLQEEKKLAEYDYIFYIDADMRIIAPVGDEIMGDGLTMAQHPMYALARRYIPPYEPNPNSTAYMPRFGIIKEDEGKLWFDPLYAAGGFQGGKSADFLKAMWSMKRAIDKDLNNNYIAIWNDESHWNYYLSQNPPAVVLDPGYCYPDSIIAEYYEKIWGCKYQPKIITLTKKFNLTPGGATAIKDTLGQML